MNHGKITVAVIIPVYNEERHIEKCVASIFRQDYPLENIEYIFVDGRSTDRTPEILDNYAKQYSFIKVLHNPNRTVPYAMNLGIKNAQGEYIIRFDGHSEYMDDYVSKCIEYLKKTRADNVGGLAISKSKGYIGNTISCVLSSIFGVGNSSFRTGGREGYVDTVPFGAFRKEVFERYGFYDVRLSRNQDIELNHRIIKNGGRIYLTPAIKLFYFNREKLWDFVKQSYSNGLWNIITWFLCPGSLSVRHFIPFIFVVSLLFLSLLYMLSGLILFKWLLLLELAAYALTDLFFSIKSSLEKGLIYLPVLPFMFLILHVSYGFGSFIGLGRSILLHQVNNVGGKSQCTHSNKSI